MNCLAFVCKVFALTFTDWTVEYFPLWHLSLRFDPRKRMFMIHKRTERGIISSFSATKTHFSICCCMDRAPPLTGFNPDHPRLLLQSNPPPCPSQEEMTSALATMRVDYDQVKIKDIDTSSNPLLNKRRKKAAAGTTKGGATGCQNQWDAEGSCGREDSRWRRKTAEESEKKKGVKEDRLWNEWTPGPAQMDGC